jgi:hypothetical protein
MVTNGSEWQAVLAVKNALDVDRDRVDFRRTDTFTLSGEAIEGHREAVLEFLYQEPYAPEFGLPVSDMLHARRIFSQGGFASSFSSHFIFLDRRCRPLSKAPRSELVGRSRRAARRRSSSVSSWLPSMPTDRTWC